MLRKRYGGVVFWHARKWICQQPRGNAGTPDGTFSYTYDGNNNLDEVTRPDTKTTAYHYENGSFLNALTGITDAASIRFSSYGYNGSGKAILSEHAGNAGELNVSYNGADSTTTNALGKDTTYNFKNFAGVRQAVQENLASATHSPAATRYYNYDQYGRVIGITDWEGITTRYSYDDRGNITQVINAEGTSDQRIRKITYNNSFNLPLHAKSSYVSRLQILFRQQRLRMWCGVQSVMSYDHEL